MITIANPIYDAVFKYLMEDERIARTILSALLQKNIVKVEVRPHEYSNSNSDKLSIFRIDFGATIREEDGSEHLILIELQKTWIPTETLRFRQYLVGDIEEPVLYVRHQSFDYEGNLVTKGLPNPFVDSLTHESVIVQIPRLDGRINNRLYEVLSIFDQTRKSAEDQHMLNLEDDLYPEEDTEMQHILRRLLMAATNADMRMDMNVEDEYYSIIEKQDTEILQRDRRIAEQRVEIAAKDEQRDIEARIEDLEKILKNVEVVDEEDVTADHMAVRVVRAGDHDIRDVRILRADDFVERKMRLGKMFDIRRVVVVVADEDGHGLFGKIFRDGRFAFRLAGEAVVDEIHLELAGDDVLIRQAGPCGGGAVDDGRAVENDGLEVAIGAARLEDGVLLEADVEVFHDGMHGEVDREAAELPRGEPLDLLVGISHIIRRKQRADEA